MLTFIKHFFIIIIAQICIKAAFKYYLIYDHRPIIPENFTTAKALEKFLDEKYLGKHISYILDDCSESGIWHNLTTKPLPFSEDKKEEEREYIKELNDYTYLYKDGLPLPFSEDYIKEFNIKMNDYAYLYKKDLQKTKKRFNYKKHKGKIRAIYSFDYFPPLFSYFSIFYHAYSFVIVVDIDNKIIFIIANTQSNWK